MPGLCLKGRTPHGILNMLVMGDAYDCRLALRFDERLFFLEIRGANLDSFRFGGFTSATRQMTSWSCTISHARMTLVFLARRLSVDFLFRG